MGYLYLASPYSAPTLQVRVNRFMAAQDATIWLLKHHKPVYSPIQVWHHIKEISKLPTNYEFWKKQNDAMLLAADSIAVLIIPGWRESKGVRYELEVARKRDLRCFTMVPVKEKWALVEMSFKTWTPDSVLSQ